ncbi:MAG: hypothetical protein D6679_01245 [Candidatus Hydrogenedentota bacterium]|nr:MAG: hypothetical protein D6679_01245 [Candidatus Hydrogenedentota bacterium]
MQIKRLLKEVRLSWLITGVVVLVILLGLFFDIWRTYAVRKSLEHDVVAAAKEAGAFLPFRPRQAVEAGLDALRKRGLKPGPTSVVVGKDGKTIDVSIRSEVRAYFAWLVGAPKLKFTALARGEVVVEGGGPVSELERSDIAFALRRYDSFRVGQEIVVWPSASGDVPGYAVKAFRVSGPRFLRVGEEVELALEENLAKFSSKSGQIVVIFEPESDGEEMVGTVVGFAAIDASIVDEKGRLVCRTVKKRLEGEEENRLGAAHDFGVWRGGVSRMKVKVVR